MTFNINVGDKAPPFQGLDIHGHLISSDILSGLPYVLYFYPKDHTPGCTKEACQFRDIKPQIDQLNAALIGISPDPISVHAKFIEEYHINFTLLSDEDCRVCKAFDVWQENLAVGKESMGLIRATFIVDHEGIIRWIERPVEVEGHAERVLNALRTIS